METFNINRPILIMKNLISFILIGFSISAFAQVGISTEQDENWNPKTTLEVHSTTSGVLIPRLEIFRINEKNNNHEGEMFYSKENNCLMVNIAEPSATYPEWKCVKPKGEAIPKTN